MNCHHDINIVLCNTKPTACIINHSCTHHTVPLFKMFSSENRTELAQQTTLDSSGYVLLQYLCHCVLFHTLPFSAIEICPV